MGLYRDISFLVRLDTPRRLALLDSYRVSVLHSRVPRGGRSSRSVPSAPASATSINSCARFTSKSPGTWPSSMKPGPCGYYGLTKKQLRVAAGRKEVQARARIVDRIHDRVHDLRENKALPRRRAARRPGRGPRKIRTWTCPEPVEGLRGTRSIAPPRNY